jgi:hypothetical protein
LKQIPSVCDLELHKQCSWITRYIACKQNHEKLSTYLLKGRKLEATSEVKPFAHLIKL